MSMFNDINLKGPSMSDDPMRDFKSKEQIPETEYKKEIVVEYVEEKKEEEQKPIQKQEVAQPQQKKNAIMEIEIDNGDMVVTTMEQKVAMIQAAIKGKMLPSRYQDVGTVLAGMQYSKEIGLGGSLVSLRQIAVVDGTPTIFGDLGLSICYKSGLVESIKEYYLDKDQKEISLENKNLNAQVEFAVCEIKRKGDPEKLTTFFSLADAAKAGLAGRGVWQKYTKLMLKYRARSEALKSKFPDFLNGVGIGEYDFHGIDEKTSNREDHSDLEKKVFG